MATEISFSGGLTFRVTDSNGNVKFDINKRQPKVVAMYASELRKKPLETVFWETKGDRGLSQRRGAGPGTAFKRTTK